MGEKWFVLVNPAAGGYKVEKLWPQIEKLLNNAGIDFQYQISKSANDAILIIGDRIHLGFRNFIALGGDGTLNMVVNGIFQQDTVDPKTITIAIIPVGTGNDWIRTQHIPKSIPKAIQIILRKKSMLHDIGRIELQGDVTSLSKYFINMAGFGFQGFVAERIEGVSSSIKKGIFAFVLGLFDALFKYHETPMTIEFDQQKMKGSILNVNAGICKYCGGGMKMAPDAVANDGFFDVTIVKKISKAEVIIEVPRLFSGKFVKNKKVSQYQTKTISIISDPLVPVECDGEVLGNGNVRVEILEKAVNVIIP